MNIQGSPTIVISNGILSGFYVQDINEGIRPKLYEFSSPSYSIAKFSPPYDAVLPNSPTGGPLLAAVARRVRDTATFNSNLSGKLYFYNDAELYGACHGYGRDGLTFYNGQNFYQAFYPAGYFAPPFGENISIYLANKDGTDNLSNGSCSTMSYTEYNEQYGIISQGASSVNIITESLTPNAFAPIFSPRGVCPSDVAISNYYDEVQFRQIQGTTTQIGGGTFYNHNAIPTSLDSFRVQLTAGRYVISGEGDNRVIVFANFRPVASYTADSQINDLNNTLCPAITMETSVSAGRGSNGVQLIEAPDLISQSSAAASSSQVFVNQGLDTHFYYWHFLFRENSDGIPFTNNEIGITARDNHARTISEDTQLFDAVLSSEDSYWQNRQCPASVDFLPWTLGASIYACPSKHFDIPYYAATKKFGFYGTRFLNTCNKLNLTNTWNGVDNASEVPASTGMGLSAGENEPAGIDAGGSWSFSAYDNLLRTAGSEERYSNMYAINKGFFIWANTPFVTGTPQFQQLSSIDGFVPLFNSLVQPFQNIFTGGLSSFISGEPSIIMQTGMAGAVYVADNSQFSEILLTDNIYQRFLFQISDIVDTKGKALWTDIEKQFANYISDGHGINEAFYSNIVSGREKRMLTRYMENVVQGNPIDLFPLNSIYFSFDSGKEMLEHTGWARAVSFPSKTNLPPVGRRYFEGAYGKASAISGLSSILSQLDFSSSTSFYPGFFNDLLATKDLPTPSYVPVVSGIIMDEKRRRYSPSGWLALGYNEIGALDGNFSCFTPIFIQHPATTVVTKIGQAPTFRALAVDYHTIPDDKLNGRYPEIMYWASKLKMLSSTFHNLYPLKYRWMRVEKNKYLSFLASGNLTKVDYASSTGDWACLEGDGPECTVIHPQECVPTGVQSEDSYTFMKGAKKNIDDTYYYMCVASGRFGIRMSEKSELEIEDWLRFDLSFKNGINKGASSSDVSIAFGIVDKNNQYNEITFYPENNQAAPAYMGYQQDVYAIPESVIEQKVPPPNAGYGDVTAYRFVGPIGYVGATRSWQPDTLMDTRGLRGSWGRFIEYGSLMGFSKKLNQIEGDLLYGYKHLPVCENYQMNQGQHGIKVIGKFMGYYLSHWTLSQQAVAALETTAGMKWDSLGNVGELYPPITRATYSPDENGKVTWSIPGNDPLIGGYGIGHWQWGNNLGSIKRFGKYSTQESNDIVFVGNGSPPSIEAVKNKLITSTTLAGENCGYSSLGLGRNMIYYVESFGRFYLLCDLLKKKNVKNLSFMCPGLRASNSAIQYFWMGKPTNTYLERRPMYGPYAYQWRVRRHNRDRNGNGISQGFYSMGYDTPYSLMYDAPAIFGLYVKPAGYASASYKGAINNLMSLRKKAFPNGIGDPSAWRNNWFGVGGSEGGSKSYGNAFCANDSTSPLCDYISAATSLAGSPDFQSYGCNEAQLQKGQCFDPCMSMRNAQGFLPEGKSQNLFGGATSPNGMNKQVRLVSSANLNENNGVITNDEQSVLDNNVVFRAPVNTPYARIKRGLKDVGGYVYANQANYGVSPCNDGGSDHCNYMTPTIHLKTSTMLMTSVSAFTVANNYSANLFEAYNIRGDES